MSDIFFLDLNDVLQIHTSTIDEEGGSHGIRDIALVESAVAAPRSSFGGEYLHPDLASMAAAYMFSLVCNHGFVDGNKRVGTLAALVFLDSNGVTAFPPAEELEQITMALARGELGKDELVAWWSQPT